MVPPTDRHLLQALMLIKNCTDNKAANIIVIIPYMAYARQDKAFLEGEVVSMALVAKLLEVCGAKQFITVDIHSRLALSYFTISASDLSPIPLLANYHITNMLKRGDNNNVPLIVSPDYGGIPRAQEFSRILKTNMIALKKIRDRKTAQIFIDDMSFFLKDDCSLKLDHSLNSYTNFHMYVDTYTLHIELSEREVCSRDHHHYYSPVNSAICLTDSLCLSKGLCAKLFLRLSLIWSNIAAKSHPVFV